jgi:hypothetical protein
MRERNERAILMVRAMLSVGYSAIAAKVKMAFMSKPAVGVETFKGVVQLRGFVDTQDAKNQAEGIARAVRGVTSVTNNLIVNARYGVTDDGRSSNR